MVVHILFIGVSAFMHSPNLRSRKMDALYQNAYNKLPKFAAKSAAGTNTHWASPNNVRICPLAKRYVSSKSHLGLESVPW